MYFNKQKHNNSAEKTPRITKILQNDTKTVKINSILPPTWLGSKLIYEKITILTDPCSSLSSP